MFATPYGLRLADTWRIIMASSALPQIIKEHAPPGWDELPTWAIVGFAAIYLFLLAGVPRKEIRIVWLLPLVWFYLGMSRVRHAPLFSIIGILAIADFFPKTYWAKRLVSQGSDWFMPPADEPKKSSMLWLAIPLVVWILCLSVQSQKADIPVIGSHWAQLDPTLWPVDLEENLSKIENEHAEPVDIFNEFIHGGYLIQYHPKMRVFIDDRCELFITSPTDNFLLDFVQGEYDDPAGHIAKWEARFGKFPYAMPRTDSGYDQYFSHSDAWVLIQRGQSASLYRRK
jgi:hypothetical protein